jgi:L-asparaginase type II
MTEQKPLVWVLGTGGTVSSWGSPRLVFFDYGRSGERLGVSKILERVPEIYDYARIQTEQITQAKSGNVGPGAWLRLSKRINELLRDPEEASGVVVFHGTSSMEETAYWLNLTIKSAKPVVLTGAMRPPSALSTDADNNLLRAVILARSEEARAMGVTIMLNDEIHAAREVTKRNSYRLETFGTHDLGMLGYLDSDLKAVFYRTPKRRHTFQSEFDISGLTELPRVDIVYGYEGADGLLVRALMDAKVPGIILAGMGSGGVGDELTSTLAEARHNGAVIVVTTRTGSGRVIRTAGHVQAGFVAGDNLSPQKARILLQLALTVTKDVEQIQQLFERY